MAFSEYMNFKTGFEELTAKILVFWWLSTKNQKMKIWDEQDTYDMQNEHGSAI